MTVIWYIYALSDPRTEETRYVGFSSRPEFRFQVHLNEACCGFLTHKCNWIRSLLQLGLEPQLRILDDGVGPGWQEVERFYIKFFREEVGARLTNATDGGDGVLGGTHTPLTLERMADAGRQHKGKKRSLETRARMSEAGKGKHSFHHTSEAKEKIRVSSLGNKHPLGHKASQETRQKLATNNWWLKLEPELRTDLAKQAAARRWGG